MVGYVENLCAKVSSRVLSQGKLLRQCNIRLSGSKFSESVSASRSNHVWRWLVERRGIQLPSARCSYVPYPGRHTRILIRWPRYLFTIWQDQQHAPGVDRERSSGLNCNVQRCTPPVKQSTGEPHACDTRLGVCCSDTQYVPTVNIRVTADQRVRCCAAPVNRRIIDGMCP